jgi:cobalamin synthase
MNFEYDWLIYFGSMFVGLVCSIWHRQTWLKFGKYLRIHHKLGQLRVSLICLFVSLLPFGVFVMFGAQLVKTKIAWAPFLGLAFVVGCVIHAVWTENFTRRKF